MASPDVPANGPVTVPDLVGLPVRTARDVARRCLLVATSAEPGTGAADDGIVLGQQPEAHTTAPRWSGVVIWTASGGGGAGVREPRRPVPPPRETRADRGEPGALPQT